jgi:hypothetical protein
MDSFTLGQAPYRMTVVLSPGTDFVATMTRDDGQPWPDGTVIELALVGGATWPGTVAGASVNWDVNETLVQAAVDAGVKHAKLYHVNGDTRVLWAAGPVVVR